MLYSKKGVYILMDGTDRKLTTTMTEPFAHLWKEDVYEVFLWPDERHTFYFEYEISPTNHELPIMVPNVDGKFFGWTPWDYKGRRKIEKATSATGGLVNVLDSVLGGAEHHNRRLAAYRCAKRAQKFDAVHDRHVPIEKDDVGHVAHAEIESHLAVLGLLDREIQVFDDSARHHANDFGIIDNQTRLHVHLSNSHNHGSRPPWAKRNFPLSQDSPENLSKN